MSQNVSRPDETCSCGAALFVKSQGIDGIERERASFREAHRTCRERPAPVIQQIPPPQSQGTAAGGPTNCPYCGLPWAQCRGHMICEAN